MSRRVSDHYVEWIEEKLDEIDSGDNLRWDGEMFVMNREGAAGFMVHIFLPSPVMGDSFHIFAPIGHPNMQTKDYVQSVVQGLVEQIRQLRTRVLQQGGGPGSPETNGQPQIVDPRMPPPFGQS